MGSRKMSRLQFATWMILLICLVHIDRITPRQVKSDKRSRITANRRGWIDDLKKLFGIKTETILPGTTEASAKEKDCQAGWIAGPNGACYFVPSPGGVSHTNFAGAQKECQLKAEESDIHGVHVVSIETLEEQKFIEQILAPYPEEDYWTNGNRFNEGHRPVTTDLMSTWHWGDDDQSIQSYGFENWDEGQPNWINFIDEEKCIFIGHKSRFNFKWHDHRCSYDGANYLCEYNRNDKNKSIPVPGPEPDPEPEEKECHLDWIAGPNRACYFVPKYPKWSQATYAGAQSECQREGEKGNIGAHVVSIESLEEQRFIEQILAPYPGQDFWTNGNRLHGNDDKIWHWGDEDRSIESYGFVNWDEGQPQWKNFIDDEKCIFLGHKNSFNLRWHDHRCSYDGPSYVCEYNRNEMPTSSSDGGYPPVFIPETKPEPEPEPEPEDDSAGSGHWTRDDEEFEFELF